LVNKIKIAVYLAVKLARSSGVIWERL